MPCTQRGVYHNLKESKYTISNSEVVFFFSSMFLLNKFLDGYQTHREWYKKKLKVFDKENPLNTEILADLHYYKQVEKRGFRALIRGVDVEHKDLYQYALRKMSEKIPYQWIMDLGYIDRQKNRKVKK
jgi:hypothetical protein